MTKMTIKKTIKNLGIILSGIGLSASLIGCQGELGGRKYDTEGITIIDTLGIDTIEEELALDHLYDYLIFKKEVNLKKYIRYKITKENLKFKTIYYGPFNPTGSLKVSKEGFFKYKFIDNLFNDAEESKEMNYKVYKFYSLDKNFKIEQLTIGGADFKSGKPSLITDRTYSKETKGGEKMLNDEQKEVNECLDKIKEYKKLNGSWKD
ncbi:hypothetical protein HYT91_02955 [Candidatus Pacearchaeota archaeon]|nr:hypothetical protein [Candidatus Pacearchaeota archaeon]